MSTAITKPYSNLHSATNFIDSSNNTKAYSSSFFAYSQSQLKENAQFVLDYAKSIGTTSAAVELADGSGFSVTVRKNLIETIERNQDKTLAVTVFIGQCSGHASTSDFSITALKATVEAAYNIAKYTAIDDCAGLAPKELLENNPPELDLFHPWNLSVEQAIDLARQTEQAALSLSPLIINSEGANVSVQHSHFVLATSTGFMNGYPSSRHTISCSPIAGYEGQMQRDGWYCSKRNPKNLANPKDIGQYAAKRALARLNPKIPSTRKCAVLFEAPMAIGLLGAFVQAISGGALYRKASFLLNCMSEQIFPDHISITESAHCLGEIGSAPFDAEGVRTMKRNVVENGIVRGYFLSSYSARKLGMETTGNAGGSHYLQLRSSLNLASANTSSVIYNAAQDGLKQILQKMGTGFLVTELMGDGVNYITGDYSRGASGYWVEGGEIIYPVEGITIAGNLREMFKQIVAVGDDLITLGSKQTGSILIQEVSIAGQ